MERHTQTIVYAYDHISYVKRFSRESAERQTGPILLPRPLTREVIILQRMGALEVKPLIDVSGTGIYVATHNVGHQLRV